MSLGAFRRDRTADLSLFRGALYRLSYKGIGVGRGCATTTSPASRGCPPCVGSCAACARPAARSSRLRPWTSPTVPAVGVEPTCPVGHRGLSSARMPFRQAGVVSLRTPPRTRTGNIRGLSAQPLPDWARGAFVWWRKVVHQTTDTRFSLRCSSGSPSLAFTTFPALGVHPADSFRGYFLRATTP